jgi:HlyD family secretion protein
MTVAREQPRAHNRNTALVVGGIILLALIAVGAWAFFRTRPEPAAVTRRDIVALVPLNGEVVAPPSERADVMAPYQAPVAKVYTSIGQNVRRGETLVELSLPNAQEAYQQARANVEAAEAALASAREQADDAVEATKQRLDAARSTEKTARQAAAAPVTVPPAATEGTDPAAAPSVPAPSVTVQTPSPDLQRATQERIAAEQALQDAKAQLEAALTPFKQQLEYAREAFQDAQSGRKQALVRAPISGTVLALNAQTGQEVGRDRKTPLVTIVDLDALEVQGVIKPEQAAFVKKDMPAVITVGDIPNEQFEGEVEAVTTRPGRLGGQQYIAIVDLKNKHGLVKPGHKASVGIRAGEVKSALAVPNDAVQEDGSGRPSVNVLRNGSWQPVVVELGLSDGRYTEIKNGLREGETVQVKPDLL